MPVIVISENTTGSTHSGVDDTRIYNNAATTNYGSDSALQVQNNGFEYAEQGRILLRFALPAALNGATITGVRLRLRVFDGSDGTSTWTADLHELLREFVEAQATYNIWSTGNNWATAGGLGTGDYSATVLGTRVLQSGTYWREWNDAALVALLQAKATASAPSVSFILKPTTTNAGSGNYCSIRSSEGTDGERPILEIDYTAGAGGGTTVGAGLVQPILLQSRLRGGLVR